ncbi:MAG: hypothetical protein ACK5VJ_00430 [Pseudomonadota bacterium]|jgi:hypothetical protein
MITAKILPLVVLALGVGVAVAPSAQELITWTREMAPPTSLPAAPITSGLVVLTREASDGLSRAELAEKLQAHIAQLEREQYAQNQVMAALTKAEIAQTRQALEQNMNAQLAAKDAATNTKLAAVVRRVEAVSASALQPTDVRALAAQTVADSAPEFEALALNTLKGAEGYVRTVARQAVMDDDPAMRSALGEAVAVALNQEQSPAAFSMRKAIVNELANVVQGPEAATLPTTRLGNDVAGGNAASNTTEAIDAARLRLGRLLNPGVAPADNATQMATLTPNHDARDAFNAGSARARTDLMDLRDYKVVLHADNLTLPAMLGQIIERAEPFTGPWQVRWRLKPENEDLLTERFSLDAETTFSEFVGYLAQYLVNDRGVKLTFSLFDRERVVLVSD